MTQPRNPSDANGPLADPLDGVRPLSARSVVASTLLGMSPPELPVRLLVRCGELFGISQGATRTAISRMVRAGELVADGDRGVYALAGPLLARHARQAESRRPQRRRWDGRWTQAVVATRARSAEDRGALRAAMRTLHLAELREGVWLRPDNLDPRRHPAATVVVDEQCRRFELAPVASPGELVGELWDLEGWVTTARGLVAELVRALPRLEAGDEQAIAPGFVLSAAALRHLVADPLLPDQLVGRDWPGEELRSTYDRYDEAFKDAWRSWFQRAWVSP